MICKKMSNLDFFMYKYDIWLEKSDNDEDKKIGVDFDDDFDAGAEFLKINFIPTN